MSRSAAIQEQPAAAPVLSEYLGPARVTEVAGSQLTVELPGGEPVPARMALAFPYQPARGDTLLVIGRGEACYVIGVLEGTGEATLRFAGGVEVRAEGGPLRLVSDEGVHVAGPEVSIEAGTLRVLAQSAVQKLGTFYQHVRSLWSVRARETETIVEEGALTRAKSATILTEETMSINGKQIHLG